MEAPLLTFVSGSGGVGKSTLALASSWLAARCGISVALVEADLQFGDIGYWMGLDDEVPNLGAGSDCVPVYLEDNLALFKAPAFPEVAESVSDEVADFVDGLRSQFELVVADTGQFWSGLTADLVSKASIVALVMDNRASSVMAALRAEELCGRIGVASSRVFAVYNRYSGKARLSMSEVKTAFGAGRVFRIADGKAAVDAMLCAGALSEFASSGNAAVADLDSMLTDVLPRMGMLYVGMEHLHARRGFFR